ncbi:amidohydrolase family protein [Streptomyces albipurpureus]|uniref:Amidohydrolase family protein n=1 Tax=Streptomyces albipurpureus TaxID=2897419 RepID=A0ABT0UFN0_9ACTN|nr:amidohydrolase family protein [Streptomyces sp. CWNU-1]MCM2386799.1 amidohydrolase family protein [Streptomyces sp. CWNU-1]
MPLELDLLIRDGRVHGREDLVDLHIRDGKVIALVPSGSTTAEASEILDAGGGLVSRSFTEPHYHPDKAYSRSLAPSGARDSFERARLIKAGFTVEDVTERAVRALKLASANGVTTLRANVDVDSYAGLRGLHGVLAARERVAHLMDVEIVAFPQEGLDRDPESRSLLVEALKSGADLIGGWPNVEDGIEAQRANVREIFDLAERFDVGVDIHADCMIDPSETMLEYIAQETVRRGYQGRVLASHCCGLEVYTDTDAARTIAAVVEADVRIVVVPLNLLDGGPRGLSRPQELMAAGAIVAAGSDNMNDGWYPLGTLDPLDRAQMAFFGAGFHDEGAVDTAWELVCGQAAAVIGGRPGDIAVGEDADLVLFDAPDRATALANMPSSRVTLRRGQVVSRRDTGSRTVEPVAP